MAAQAQLQRAVGKREVVELRVRAFPRLMAEARARFLPPSLPFMASCKLFASKQRLARRTGKTVHGDCKGCRRRSYTHSLTALCVCVCGFCEQGLACEDKRAAANIEHRQQTMLEGLKRTLAQVSANAAAAQARVAELTEQHAQLEGQAAQIDARCDALRAQEEVLRAGTAAAASQKYQVRALAGGSDLQKHPAPYMHHGEVGAYQG